jgi:DNA-binding transcriptional MerR regulator
MQRKQFRIGELAQHLGVERFVVRFWEREFGLRPTRSEGGQRFYEERDLDKFQKIKELLYNEKLTIAGAKKRLLEHEGYTPAREIQEQPLASTPEQLKVQLQDLRKQLVELSEKL